MHSEPVRDNLHVLQEQFLGESQMQTNRYSVRENLWYRKNNAGKELFNMELLQDKCFSYITLPTPPFPKERVWTGLECGLLGTLRHMSLYT